MGLGQVLSCPDRRNDSSVRSMLCPACCEARFPSKLSALAEKSTAPTDIVANANAPCSASEDSHLTQSRTRISPPSNVGGRLVVNKLLFFQSNKFDNHPKSVILSTISDFYREDEIFTAKELIVPFFDTSAIPSATPLVKNRVGNKKMERSADDIINLFSLADEHSLRQQFPTF